MINNCGNGDMLLKVSMCKCWWQNVVDVDVLLRVCLIPCCDISGPSDVMLSARVITRCVAVAANPRCLWLSGNTSHDKDSP